MPAKIYPTQNSFNAGEISELISGFRDDIAKYKTACKTLENAIPLVEGGAKKMPGTYFGGACPGVSRLVPFQFSTAQGAFLEFSDGLIRIWVNDGLVDAIGTLNYNPVTAYVPGNTVLVGPYGYFLFSVSNLYLTIAAPYGQNNAVTVSLDVTVNSSDVLAVTKTGSSPNQGINIALANTTTTKNAASLIQAAIRALGSLNSAVDNHIDLSAWTATPSPVYYGSPPITASGSEVSPIAVPIQDAFTCLVSNQNDQFPAYGAPSWGPGTAVPSGVLGLVTPYAEEDLFVLDCSTQSADVLWIFHPSYPPACVERLAANAWKYSTSPPGTSSSEPAYRGTLGVVKTGYSALGQSITAITKASPCVVTVAATTAAFSAGDRIYINLCAGMVELNEGEFLVYNPSYDGNGNLAFSLQDPDTLAVIDSSGYLTYTGGGFAVAVVPLFSAAGDYPACGTFYQERLVVGGSDNNPTQINGSVADDYPDFICDPNEDDYGYQFTLVSTKIDQILNAIGSPNALLLGTASGVWIVTGSNGASVSQSNVNAAKQTTWGVSALQPQMVGEYALFVSRSARIVMMMIFNFVANQWENLDLTRLNRNITVGPSAAESGIVQTAMQIEPYPILWAVRADGQLLGLVFNQQDQVFAWFRVNMLPEGGKVESVAVITQQNAEDQVAIVVNRTINGVTQRYFEYFMPQELFGDLSNAFFVHSGQQLQLSGPFNITGITNASPAVVTAPGHNFVNGQQVQISGVNGMVFPTTQQSINQDKTQFYTVANSNTGAGTFELAGMNTSFWSGYVSGGSVMQVTNTVTGMTYLMGQDVVAVGDGSIILVPTEVTADAVVFPYYCNLITIGLPYEVTIEPTNPVVSTASATTRGMKQKLDRVTLSLYESMGGQFGTDLAHMYDITYGPGSTGQDPEMWTGELTRDLDSDWDDNSTFTITQDDPLPFTVRGLVMRMNYNPD